MEKKSLLVLYVNVNDIPQEDMKKHLIEISKNFRRNRDKNIITYVVPVNQHESRIDFINPKFVSEQDYVLVKGFLDKEKEIMYGKQKTFE